MNMDIKEIQALLEKYFEGNTTLEEDQALLDYFSADAIDPKLRSWQQQFRLLQTAREPLTFDPGFENRLAELIEAENEIPFRKHKTRKITRFAIAATIAVLIGISGVIVLNREWHEDKDTFSDPQLAYAEAQKTLLFVSQKMNQGMKPLTAVSKINAGAKPLKSLKKLDHSMDMLNRVSFMNQSSNLKK
jgi:hypothetical protein